MNGLAKQTEKIFQAISLLPCISGYTLIGGTALALQINRRKSEDLDFCIWSKNPKTDKPTVNWPAVEKDLSSVGRIYSRDILGFDQVNFVLEGVKISFIAKQTNSSPVTQPIPILNQIIAADLVAIGSMKIELMLRRSEFRDYYDLYSILMEGYSLKELIGAASRYSNRLLKSRDALSFLARGSNYPMPKGFALLEPYYEVNQTDIEAYMRKKITEEF